MNAHREGPVALFRRLLMAFFSLGLPVICGGAAGPVRSPLMHGGMAAAPLALDVSGAKELTLVATVGPDNQIGRAHV